MAWLAQSLIFFLDSEITLKERERDRDNNKTKNRNAAVTVDERRRRQLLSDVITMLTTFLLLPKEFCLAFYFWSFEFDCQCVNDLSLLPLIGSGTLLFFLINNRKEIRRCAALECCKRWSSAFFCLRLCFCFSKWTDSDIRELCWIYWLENIRL